MSDNPDWWRFTGLGFLKPFIPDRVIQRAKTAGHGWVKWYEPVCKRCHPTQDDLIVVVAEIETINGPLVVTRCNGVYTIKVNDIVRHPNATADEAVGAMAHYLHGAEYSLKKIKDNSQISNTIHDSKRGL